MHTLDMRVCTVSLFDSAWMPEGEGERFVFGRAAEGFSWERFLPRLDRIYERLHAAFGGAPRFALEKGIPSGAGLGGSTALAVCMTKLWAERAGRTPDDALLLSLGSDAPYMYIGGDARVTGRGERVERLPFAEREVFILLPGEGVDTAKAYAGYDRMKETGELPEREGEYHNDLFAPAAKLVPAVGEAYALLRSLGAERVVMTGSGSESAAPRPRVAERRRDLLRQGRGRLCGRGGITLAGHIRQPLRRGRGKPCGAGGADGICGRGRITGRHGNKGRGRVAGRRVRTHIDVRALTC